MRSWDREQISAALGTFLIVTLIGIVAWLGLRTGYVGVATAPPPHPTPTAQPSSPETSPPPSSTTRTSTPRPTAPAAAIPVVPVAPDVAAAFAAEAGELGGQYALAWVEADGLHILGTPAADTAWSTIKVPLAIAALDAAPTAARASLQSQVDAALQVSDNDAARALWSGLGSPEQAAQAVDEVLDAHNDVDTRTQSQTLRPPFTPFGQTHWGLADQVRFAEAVRCADPTSHAATVRESMSQVIPDQRWGLGRLDSAHFKGGWGPQEDGGYVVRQLGDVAVDGEQVAIAASSRAVDGSFEQGTADLNRLVQWWAATVDLDPRPCAN
ncbi:MAG: hypothetical protein Q4G67_07795 [Actinomycetia bacterium]|nr:hypothetical protein [Actinomycetes bacterium]